MKRWYVRINEPQSKSFFKRCFQNDFFICESNKYETLLFDNFPYHALVEYCGLSVCTAVECSPENERYGWNLNEFVCFELQVIGSMDNHTAPCTNFWNFACHNWLVSNPMPPWASKWSNREELSHRGKRIQMLQLTMKQRLERIHSLIKPSR